MSLKRAMSKFTARLAAVREICRYDNLRFLGFAPPGHFYSPLPDAAEVRRRARDLFRRDIDRLPGIELRQQQQLELVEAFKAYYAQMPFAANASAAQRYHLDNVFFSFGDGVLTYSIMRHYRPRRIVEVGSGFSSAAMLDVNDAFFDGAIDFTFIEPFPERLNSLLSARDRERCRIEARGVQEVSLQCFDELERNDILFIDSSHVVKIGSDVHHLLFNILPRLKDGVIVHFHDILWPFEYPQNWLDQGRAWNEAYMLRAFLTETTRYEILLFNSWLAERHADVMRDCLPLSMTAPSSAVTHGNSSLWISVGAV